MIWKKSKRKSRLSWDVCWQYYCFRQCLLKGDSLQEIFLAKGMRTVTRQAWIQWTEPRVDLCMHKQKVYWYTYARCFHWTHGWLTFFSVSRQPRKPRFNGKPEHLSNWFVFETVKNARTVELETYTWEYDVNVFVSTSLLSLVDNRRSRVTLLN